MTVKILAHDISNQLTTIGMLIKRLKNNEHIDSDAEVLIERIKRATINISNICSNTVNISYEKYDIGEVIKESVLHTCVDIKVVVHKNSGNIKMLNKTVIQQMVDNILKNSLEAGATKVNIFIDKNSLEFVDNGHGITNKQLKNMVSSNSVSTKGDNRGHGLRSIKKCCADHKFEFSLQPNDCGLTVKIKI